MKVASVDLLSKLTSPFRRHKYLALGITANALALQLKAQATTVNSNYESKSGLFVSSGTLILILVGIVISFFYIKGMAEVLSNAAKTYNSPEIEFQGNYNDSLFGTILAVLASAAVIGSYGLGPSLLYLGPILCILSPIGIIYFMFLDIQGYKESA